jgi:hypothetical protein
MDADRYNHLTTSPLTSATLYYPQTTLTHHHHPSRHGQDVEAHYDAQKMPHHDARETTSRSNTMNATGYKKEGAEGHRMTKGQDVHDTPAVYFIFYLFYSLWHSQILFQWCDRHDRHDFLPCHVKNLFSMQQTLSAYISSYTFDVTALTRIQGPPPCHV